MADDSKLRALLEQATASLKRSTQEIKELKARAQEPIAIVGMACRFPGGGNDPESFWRGMEEGRDAISRMDRRWAQVGVPLPGDAAPGAHWGGQIDQVEGFDASAFHILASKAAMLDPQQRLV